MKALIASVILMGMTAVGTAQELAPPAKGPAPRFVMVQNYDAEQGILTVTEEALPHPAVVSRAITEPEKNRRPRSLAEMLGCGLVVQIQYYTTIHKLSVHRLTLENVGGKKFDHSEEQLAALKPGTMVLLSADGHPIEPEYRPLLNPESLVLIVDPLVMPSVYESLESTPGMTKELAE